MYIMMRYDNALRYAETVKRTQLQVTFFKACRYSLCDEHLRLIRPIARGLCSSMAVGRHQGDLVLLFLLTASSPATATTLRS